MLRAFTDSKFSGTTPVYLEADSQIGPHLAARLDLFDSEELAAKAVYEQAASHC